MNLFNLGRPQTLSCPCLPPIPNIGKITGMVESITLTQCTEAKCSWWLGTTCAIPELARIARSLVRDSAGVPTAPTPESKPE